MINPNNSVHLNRLERAVQQSYETLSPWRDYRTKFVREFAGYRYSDEGTKQQKFVNLINQTAEVLTFSLVASRPRVQVSTRFKELRYFAQKYQLHLNHLIEEINLVDTLREVVLDAFFCMGIAKVYLGSTGQEIEVPNPDYEDGYHGNPENPIPETLFVDPGAPTVESVSFDDWFHDTNSMRWSRIKFCGDYYRIAYDKLKDPLFDQKQAGKLSPMRRNSGHDYETDDRASDITGSNDDDEVIDMVKLKDVWLPYEKKIVTLPATRGVLEKPLAVRDWDGPEEGPYFRLAFQSVPDNLMPSAPVQNIMDLEGLYNSLFRKLSRQAKRQKKITVASSDAKEDLENLKRSSDGEGVITTQQGEMWKEVNYGGISQENLAFAITVGDIYNKLAGNPDAIAGLGPQSGTAAQDQLIHEQVSQKQAKMAERVLAFTSDITRSLGWLLWVDAYKRQPGLFEIPDANVTVESNWTPDERDGDYEQYMFNIEPYSMAYRSPMQRAQQILGLLNNVYMPGMQSIMQQGGQIDWQALNEVLANLYDEPELKTILKFTNPPTEPEVSPQDAMTKPSSTERTYTRRNVSTGGTQESRNNVMIQTLLAGANAPVNEQQQNQVGL